MEVTGRLADFPAPTLSRRVTLATASTDENPRQSSNLRQHYRNRPDVALEQPRFVGKKMHFLAARGTLRTERYHTNDRQNDPAFRFDLGHIWPDCPTAACPIPLCANL